MSLELRLKCNMLCQFWFTYNDPIKKILKCDTMPLYVCIYKPLFQLYAADIELYCAAHPKVNYLYTNSLKFKFFFLINVLEF